MNTSDAVLVELDKFLIDLDESTPTLQVFSEYNNEAVELLREMQEYNSLILFCSGEPSLKRLILQRMKEEDIDIKEVHLIPEVDYWEVKKNSAYTLCQRYAIKYYIDETENSPWKYNSKLHRLRF